MTLKLFCPIVVNVSAVHELEPTTDQCPQEGLLSVEVDISLLCSLFDKKKYTYIDK